MISHSGYNPPQQELFRMWRHGLDRCGYHADEGMERWVGWGVIAHDLRMIDQHQVEQLAR